MAKEGKRGSGRTYKMLQQALATALTDKTVFVLGMEHRHCQDMMKQVQMMPEFAQLGPNTHVAYQSGVMQLTAGQIRFRSVIDPDWRWDRMGFMGYPPGVPVFIDHAVCEAEKGRIEKLLSGARDELRQAQSKVLSLENTLETIESRLAS